MRTSCLVLVAIGLAASAVSASAQSYPPGPYSASASNPYRGVPVMDDDDDDGPAYPPAPGLAGQPSALPQPYEVQPLPPPNGARPPAALPGTPEYARPTSPAPYNEGYATAPAGALPGPQAAPPSGLAHSGVEAIRPPGDISGAPAANAMPGYPPAPVQAAPDYVAPAYGARPQDPEQAPVGALPGANQAQTYASLPPDYRPEEGEPKEMSPQFRRQVVDYITNEPPGTLIVDTPNTFLYLILGNGRAMRYGIGVGREGFTWSGVERITRMAEWPDWHPPKEMIDRQPYLPRFMAGGESNPMGARALYLGSTVFRIHGTNQPSTIGTFVSSGCIRLVNSDIEDLYRRVSVGTRVVVMPAKPQGAQSPVRGPANGRAELPQLIR